MKLVFKENLSKMHLFGIIFSCFFVTVPLIWITFMNPENYWIWPGTAVWCGLVFLVAFWNLKKVSGVIELTDKEIKVANRGYFKDAITDLRTRVRIKNNRLLIPYEEVLDITVENGNVYLNFVGISSNVVLHPVDIGGFISELREKLSLSINIEYNTPVKSDSLVFENKVVTNAPTVITFAVIFVLLQIPGIWNIIHSGNYILSIVIAVVTIIFFVVIFGLYKVKITLTDKEIVEYSKMGDADLGMKKVPYADISEVVETKWRVDIKKHSGESVYFVPADISDFYLQLQEKLNNYRK